MGATCGWRFNAHACCRRAILQRRSSRPLQWFPWSFVKSRPRSAQAQPKTTSRIWSCLSGQGSSHLTSSRALENRSRTPNSSLA